MGIIVIPIPLSLLALMIVIVFFISLAIIFYSFIYTDERFNLFPNVKEDTKDSIFGVLAGVLAVFLSILILTTMGMHEHPEEKYFT